MALEELVRELESKARPEKAAFVAGYFKTGRGEYGEGDLFWGVDVPAQRDLARRYWRDLNLDDVATLLRSEVHEQRSTALFILVRQFGKAVPEARAQIVDFYLSHLDRVNNWDLVDTSAPHILGAYLLPRKDRSILYELADSGHLWRERVAILATKAFIAAGQFEDTLTLSERLSRHPHDLIHKAIGWMLREVGDQDRAVLDGFLIKHAATMPRTALRYAIEHYSPEERKFWLGMKAL